MARSFAATRLAANITGPRDGRVEGLASWFGPDGKWPLARSVEVPLSARYEAEFSALGFIPLCVESVVAAGAGAAAAGACQAGEGRSFFPRVQSCLAADGEGMAQLEPADRELHRQLPVLLLVMRFVHYLKIVHREQIGCWKELARLRREIHSMVGTWLAEPSAGDGEESARKRLGAVARTPVTLGRHSSRPLRQAHVRIDEMPGHAGQYRMRLHIQPNHRYGGRFFNVIVQDKLEKE